MLLTIAATAIVASACGQSVSTSADCPELRSSPTCRYSDSDNRMIFDLPSDWNYYLADSLVQFDTIPIIPRIGSPIPDTYIAFDGAAGADPANVTIPVTAAPFPVGAQIIRSISLEEKQLISRQSLLEATYDFQSAQGIEIYSAGDFSFGDDFDGISGVYGVTNNDGAEQGAIYVVAVTNPDATVMYSMAIGCTLSCFNSRSEEIVNAVESWLVNTRQ